MRIVDNRNLTRGISVSETRPGQPFLYDGSLLIRSGSGSGLFGKCVAFDPRDGKIHLFLGTEAVLPADARVEIDGVIDRDR